MPREKKKYEIDCDDVGVDFADEGRWRSYALAARGNTLEELMKDATISEIDQDGGEIRCYGLDDASGPVSDAVEEVLRGRVEKREEAEATIRAAADAKKVPAPVLLTHPDRELLEAARRAGKLLTLLAPGISKVDAKLGGELSECADTIALVVKKAEGSRG